MQTRMARKLSDGTYLVPHLLNFAVMHYDAQGTILAKMDTTLPGDEEIAFILGHLLQSDTSPVRPSLLHQCEP